MDRSELTGIILAGGKSSRMGREKGVAAFQGKPLIRHGIDLLTNYTDRILISSGNPLYQEFGFALIPDEIVGYGPAAGIAAALKRSETTWNILIACDLPFLNRPLLDGMLEKTSGFQAVIPVHHGVLEPLAGIYHKALAIPFSDAVESGMLALHKILKNCHVHYFDAEPLISSFPGLFFNINTPEELAK